MTEHELLQLKEEIDEAKELQSKLEGQREALLQQLKEEYGCSTIKQAEKLLAKMESDIGTMSDEIQDGLDKLEKEYYGTETD